MVFIMVMFTTSRFMMMLTTSRFMMMFILMVLSSSVSVVSLSFRHVRLRPGVAKYSLIMMITSHFFWRFLRFWWGRRWRLFMVRWRFGFLNLISLDFATFAFFHLSLDSGTVAIFLLG